MISIKTSVKNSKVSVFPAARGASLKAGLLSARNWKKKSGSLIAGWHENPGRSESGNNLIVLPLLSQVMTEHEDAR